jgi:hypothetical protein
MRQGAQQKVPMCVYNIALLHTKLTVDTHRTCRLSETGPAGGFGSRISGSNFWGFGKFRGSSGPAPQLVVGQIQLGDEVA